MINVSVTDSFHGRYSEQGADTDNYDSDKCQEYDLRNCYAALMDLVLAGVFDHEQWDWRCAVYSRDTETWKAACFLSTQSLHNH